MFWQLLLGHHTISHLNKYFEMASIYLQQIVKRINIGVVSSFTTRVPDLATRPLIATV